MEQYFATKPHDEAVSDMERLIDDYYRNLQANGTLKLWKRSYQAYNTASTKGSDIASAGDHDEYTVMRVNHYRNIVQHLMNLTINQRPAFEPRATNSDAKSQTQTILARGLLDYYMREKRLERDLRKAVEYSLVFAEGFVGAEWNATTGEVYSTDPDTGAEIKEGDIEYSAYEPFNVIRDIHLEDWEKRDWVILKNYINKYDLAAKYPEMADDIIMASPDPMLKKFSYRQKTVTSSESNLIPVYTFYHNRTDAVPDGRVTQFIDSRLVLVDGPMPYRSIPVYRVSGSDLVGTTQGYTPAYDLLSIQDAIDQLYSTVLTNQAAFGVQNIAAPKGSNLTVTQLAGGLNFIEFDPQLGKPEPMNLTATPPEVFNFLQMLEHTMETLSGVNSVARGNPEASLKSGAALALVQSMSIQFSQQLQNSYVQLLEDVGTATINILRDFASVPRIAMIAGKNSKGMMKEFSGEDLDQVNRVTVDAGNPMTRTTAGKVELAQMMMQANLISTPDQLLQVIQTGNLDPLIEGKTTELIAIKSENEALADQQTVSVMITDQHKLHILEHKAIISDPAIRQDAAIVEAVTQHILEHFQFLSDPNYAQLLRLLGQEPIQQQGMPQMAGGQGAPVEGGQMPTSPNEMVAQNQPNMPGMPTNPLTGQPAPAPTGA